MRIRLVNEALGCGWKKLTSCRAMILDGVDELLGMFNPYTKSEWFCFDMYFFIAQKFEYIAC